MAVDTPVVPIVETPTPVEELDPTTHGDRLVRVKIDGKDEVISLKEAAAGYSRTSHFTRQQQQLASERQAFEAQQAQSQQLQQQLHNIQSVLNNEQLVEQWLQQQYPKLLAKAQQPIVDQNPHEIATIQQARDMVQQQQQTIQQSLQAMEQKLTQGIAAKAKEIQDIADTKAHSSVIESTIKSLFESHPILTKVRRADDVMRYEVSQMNPRTIGEAIEAFKTVAQGMAEDLEGSIVKPLAPAVAPKKLSVAKIEPPGGSGPQIQPQSYQANEGRSIDWKKLGQQAELMTN